MPGQKLRYTRRIMVWLIGLCLLPLAAIAVTALLAGLLGCEVNEGGPQTCEVFGLDIGGLLNGLFVSGWLALITIPMLAAIIIVWGLFEGGSLLRKRRKERKSATQDGIEV